MDLEKLSDILKPYPSYRLRQVYAALFDQLVTDWNQASSLPEELRMQLKDKLPLDTNHSLNFSNDKKTIKALITLSDGCRIESVLMRYANGRNTVCVSSQVGCALGCLFCATGQMGFVRNLFWWEIVFQVLLFSQWLHIQFGERVTNVVFMGMGEPFLNYDQVLTAARFINRADTFGIGARKVSISTVGIVPGIVQFTNEKSQFNLAVSLHAPNDTIRSQIMPIAKQYSLNDTLQAIREYVNTTNRKVMFEYLLLSEINDQPEHAKELIHLLKNSLKSLFMINLLNYNPTGNFSASSSKAVEQFHKILADADIEATRRYKFGLDIKGACGQLSSSGCPAV